jgi:C_GCAxxG_C_C family probable redox protein
MKSHEEVRALFNQGFNCAQCVLSNFADDFLLPPDQAFRIASGFGAGMGGMGKICGAVSGAFMVLGLKYGNYLPNDKASKNKTNEKVREFAKRFEAKNHSLVCRELTGCDISTKEGSQKARDNHVFETKCPIFVTDAIAIIKTLLTE